MKVRCATCKQFVDKNEAFRRFGVSSWCSEFCYRRQKVLKREPKTRPTRSRTSDTPPAIRSLVIERDKSCRFCGTKRASHVHHIRYRSEGVDNSPQNLILLCHECHEIVHSNKRRYQPLLLGVIWMTYSGRKMTVPHFERWYSRAVGDKTQR